MVTIGSFTILSVDGYFSGPNGEIDWFKNQDEEDRKFACRSSQQASLFMLGRTTYELMASYWPTAMAQKNDPVVAKVMNDTPKIVFSKTMLPVSNGPVWKNVTVKKEINRDEILQIKERAKGPITILGSGSVVRQFADLGLIDEFGFMIVPVLLGTGKCLFGNIHRKGLRLTDANLFKNGKVYLKYEAE